MCIIMYNYYTSIKDMGAVAGLSMTGGLSLMSVMVMVIETMLIPLLGVVSTPSTLNACHRLKFNSVIISQLTLNSC